MNFAIQLVRKRLHPGPAVALAAITVLGTIAVIRLWILPMVNSFWVDETVVVWIIRNGFREIIPNTPASVASVAFCWLEWCVSRILGTSEVALRLPSVLGGIGSLYVYYRVGADLIDRETGIIFAGIYLSLRQVAFETPDARPYSLGSFAAALALLWLLRWTSSGRIHAGLVWLISSVAACYLHDFFVMPLAIESILVLVWARFRKSIPVGHVLALGLLGIVLLLPNIPRVLALSHQAKQISYFETPALPALINVIFPVYIGLAAAIIALVMTTDGERLHWTSVKAGSEAVTLGALLLFIPALGLFIFSRLTTVHIFDERYLMPAIPGLVLLWGSLLRSIEPPSFRYLSLASGLTASILVLGGSSLVPNYRPEDWKSAVRSLPGSGAMLVYSGFTEARQLELLRQPKWWGCLMAPVLVYRPSTKPENAYLAPFEIGPTDQSYMSGLLAGVLHDRNTIAVIIKRVFWGPAWLGWVSEHLSDIGFREVSDVRYGRVEVAVFQRIQPALASHDLPPLSPGRNSTSLAPDDRMQRVAGK